MDEALGAKLRDAIRGHAELAMVFGSRARGGETDRSDLDVAVRGASDLASLSARLSVAVGLEVDVVDLDGDLPIPLAAALLREGIVVHERAPGAAARWRTATLIAMEIDLPWYRRMRDAYLARVAERGL